MYLKQLMISLFFKIERLVGQNAVEKNLKKMGYSGVEAKKINAAYRKALKMCRD